MRSTRRQAYLGALKYNFGFFLNEGYGRRAAWKHARRNAAYYAFSSTDEHLGFFYATWTA